MPSPQWTGAPCRCPTFYYLFLLFYIPIQKKQQTENGDPVASKMCWRCVWRRREEVVRECFLPFQGKRCPAMFPVHGYGRDGLVPGFLDVA